MKNFEEWLRTEYNKELEPDQRIGQQLFNNLCEERPDLAERVRGCDGIDPFNAYRFLDARVTNFCDFLAKNW